MKRITFLFVLFTSLVNAQTHVFSDFKVPYAIVANGSDIYVADYQIDKIYKFNSNDSNPALEEVLTGFDSPSCFLLNGNDLYIGAFFEDKIYKIDITETNPTPIEVTSGVNGPSDLVLNGNDLYIAEHDGKKVSKVDITDTNPTPVDVISGLNVPEGIALHGNNLYIADYGDSKIYKIDISEGNPTLTEVANTGGYGLHLIDNFLYIADPNNGRIVKFDVTETNPTLIDVITNIVGPNDLTFVSNEIYFTELGFLIGRVSKYTDATLSLEENLLNNRPNIFPNPVVETLNFSGIENFSTYTLSTIQGKKIFHGKFDNKQSINVQHLSKGLYFIQLDNRFVMKFLKK